MEGQFDENYEFGLFTSLDEYGKIMAECVSK